MSAETRLTFKIANEESEFEAIHCLNYKTFVEEIPQHSRSPEQRLVDRFHSENTYAVCLDGGALVAMLAGRNRRPFSLDMKMQDLDSYLPAGRKIVEVRLLSIEKRYRNRFVLPRLVHLLAMHFADQGCDMAIISGTVRQLRLYKHVGFVPFGSLLGSGEAQFQPMCVPLAALVRLSRAVLRPTAERRKPSANYLPGPVSVHPDVRCAFVKDPVSHRSGAFRAEFRSVQRLLCSLTGARSVAILLGSGTLANDVLCAQLSLLGRLGSF